MTKDEIKKELRPRIKKTVAELDPEYCRKADGRIAAGVLGLAEFKKADTIFCFVGTSREIDTRPMIRAAWQEGKRVCVPKCVSKGVMEAYAITDESDLEIGSYGLMEPKEGLPLVPPHEIDLSILPCLTCNYDGYRLGYGGGFYDRYLERTRAKSVVVCRDRVVYDDIPVDEYDKRADIVITESRKIRLYL